MIFKEKQTVRTPPCRSKRSYQAFSLDIHCTQGNRHPCSKTQRRGGSHAKEGEEFQFPFADGSVKLAGRDQVCRTSTFIQEHPARGHEHKDVLQEESDGSQPSDPQTDDTEARIGFWSISGNHLYCHHVQPSIKTFCSKRKLIPNTTQIF